MKDNSRYYPTDESDKWWPRFGGGNRGFGPYEI